MPCWKRAATPGNLATSPSTRSVPNISAFTFTAMAAAVTAGRDGEEVEKLAAVQALTEWLWALGQGSEHGGLSLWEDTVRLGTSRVAVN